MREHTTVVGESATTEMPADQLRKLPKIYRCKVYFDELLPVRNARVSCRGPQVIGIATPTM